MQYLAFKLFIAVDPGFAQAMGSKRARKLRCSFDQKLDHTASVVNDTCTVSSVEV